MSRFHIFAWLLVVGVRGGACESHVTLVAEVPLDPGQGLNRVVMDAMWQSSVSPSSSPVMHTRLRQTDRNITHYWTSVYSARYGMHVVGGDVCVGVLSASTSCHIITVTPDFTEDRVVSVPEFGTCCDSNRTLVVLEADSPHTWLGIVQDRVEFGVYALPRLVRIHALPVADPSDETRPPDDAVEVNSASVAVSSGPDHHHHSVESGTTRFQSFGATETLVTFNTTFPYENRVVEGVSALTMMQPRPPNNRSASSSTILYFAKYGWDEEGHGGGVILVRVDISTRLYEESQLFVGSESTPIPISAVYAMEPASSSSSTGEADDAGVVLVVQTDDAPVANASSTMLVRCTPPTSTKKLLCVSLHALPPQGKDYYRIGVQARSTAAGKTKTAVGDWFVATYGGLVDITAAQHADYDFDNTTLEPAISLMLPGTTTTTMVGSRPTIVV